MVAQPAMMAFRTTSFPWEWQATFTPSASASSTMAVSSSTLYTNILGSGPFGPDVVPPERVLIQRAPRSTSTCTTSRTASGPLTSWWRYL